MENLKNYLDTLEKNVYICVYNGNNSFLCEGTITELRDNPFNRLWQLIEEENREIESVGCGKSENGIDARIIVINLYPGMS